MSFHHSRNRFTAFNGFSRIQGSPRGMMPFHPYTPANRVALREFMPRANLTPLTFTGVDGVAPHC
ncbi:hypothetical protein C8J57DRAFT_1520058 [Mycena rebaudengoi]|nr:hypothetical protein C8J57DRAFT_1520058 [Mycena rebaudengoi]